MSLSSPLRKSRLASAGPGTLQHPGEGHTRVIISGVGCGGCADEIECDLKELEGVVEAHVENDTRRIEVLLDDSRISGPVVKAHLEAMGYRIDPDITALGTEKKEKTVEKADPDAFARAHAPHHHRHHGIGCAHPPYLSAPKGPGRWVPLLGTISGIVCLIHCAALPIFMSVLVISPALVDGPLEIILIGTTMILAWVAGLAGYRHHRRPLPLLMLASGSILVLLAHLTTEHGSTTMTLTGLPGMGLLISGIWTNRHYINKSAYQMEVEHISE